MKKGRKIISHAESSGTQGFSILGVLNEVMTKCFYSASQIHTVIPKGCNSGSQPFFTRLRCRVEASRHDGIMYEGFTLIELLVVVLIIGILAAVALPQYQKAVAKAKLVKFVLQARALREDLKLYYLANGEYPSVLEDLSVWTSPVESMSAYIGQQEYRSVGGNYIRTYVDLGVDTLCCDFDWRARIPFCYTYNEKSEKLLQGLGWEQKSTCSEHRLCAFFIP